MQEELNLKMVFQLITDNDNDHYTGQESPVAMQRNTRGTVSIGTQKQWVANNALHEHWATYHFSSKALNLPPHTPPPTPLPPPSFFDKSQRTYLKKKKNLIPHLSSPYTFLTTSSS